MGSLKLSLSAHRKPHVAPPIERLLCTAQFILKVQFQLLEELGDATCSMGPGNFRAELLNG